VFLHEIERLFGSRRIQQRNFITRITTRTTGPSPEYRKSQTTTGPVRKQCVQKTRASCSFSESLRWLHVWQCDVALGSEMDWGTTASALGTFFLAMVSYPEVQKKAQEELDKVLNGRLPEHSDIMSLPYLSALIKEVRRCVCSVNI
jgi:hypothetical protein